MQPPVGRDLRARYGSPPFVSRPCPKFEAIRKQMRNARAIRSVCCVLFTAFNLSVTAPVGAAVESEKLLTGKAAMGDWTTDAPGVRRKITVEDLPPPGSNILAINPPRVVRPSAGAQLRVPSGFKVEMYASGFRDPRFLLTAPNGDILVTESRANQNQDAARYEEQR
jgi:hypothetical protein